MQAHHKAWLEAHPTRTAMWLVWMIAEGFQVHHVDGNHQNNDPKNLVLIEGVDHHRLHGREVAGVVNKPLDFALGQLAYDIRIAEDIAWDTIARRLQVKSASRVIKAAHCYASYGHRPWPLERAKTKYKRPVYRGINAV